MQKLIEAVDVIRGLYQLAGMQENADDFARTAEKLKSCENLQPIDAQECQREIDELVSASGSVRGLQDMCPPGIEFPVWCESVYALNEAAREASKRFAKRSS